MIRKDLFRFTTLRGVEDISFKDYDEVSISHPGTTKSQVINPSRDKSATENAATSSDERKRIADTYRGLRLLSDRLDTLENSTEEYQEIKRLTSLTEEDEIKAWDYLFFTFLKSIPTKRRKDFIKIIQANSLIKDIQSEQKIKLLAGRKLLLPPEFVSLILAKYEGCPKIGALNEVIGVLEFRKVEQEICCYLPGEVSHIENILAREFKEKHTRDLTRTEISDEITAESSIENLSDTSTSLRNEMDSEIGRVLDQERAFNIGGSLSVSSKPPGIGTVNANSSAGFSLVNSTSTSNNVAINFAKDVTRKATEKIVRSTKQKRTAKVIKEFESNVRHGFDNRKGNEHVTGIYRWVDQVYTNRLVNYGKRLVLNFTIPEPSNLYRKVFYEEPTPTGSEDTDTTEVGGSGDDDAQNTIKKLSEFSIVSFTDINESNKENVYEAADYFDIDIQWILLNKVITKDYGFESLGNKKPEETKDYPQPILIEEGYVCTRVTNFCQINVWHRENKPYPDPNQKNIRLVKANAVIRGVEIGEEKKYTKGATFNITNKNWYDVDDDAEFSPPLRGEINWSFQHQRVIGLRRGVLTLYLQVEPHTLETWQREVFDSLKDAYDNKVSQQDNLVTITDVVTDANEDKKERKELNSFQKRLIEQRELKRACIETIMAPFCKHVGRNFISERDCDKTKVPSINFSLEFDEYSRCAKFLENSIDWGLMNYIFHPYYWMECEKWEDILKLEDSDNTFQAFLHAGLAEITVPVKCEMSLALAFYMQTGDIHSFGELLVEDLADYNLSLAKEMVDCDEEYPVEEGKWQTRLPTSLTILQSESALVDEAGLPCCDEFEGGSDFKQLIKPSVDGSYKLLKGKDEEV